MSNLYVSDLDGTLLRSNEVTSILSNDEDDVARWLEANYKQ